MIKKVFRKGQNPFWVANKIVELKDSFLNEPSFEMMHASHGKTDDDATVVDAHNLDIPITDAQLKDEELNAYPIHSTVDDFDHIIDYKAKYRRNLLLNLIVIIPLSLIWLVIFEIPKVEVGKFGQEFEFYCFAVLIYVTFQLFFSLLVKYKHKDYEKVKDLKVALIIPIYNEEPKSIENALVALFEQSHKLKQIHIVDDGSSVDYTRIRNWFIKECQYENIYGTWEKQNNAGKREAHVRAINNIDKANCDIVVTVDSDTYIDKYAIERGIIPFKDHHVASVAGVVIARNAQANILARITDMIFVAHQQLIDRLSTGYFGQVIVNSGGLALYRRKVVEIAVESGYTKETFHKNRIIFSDDSYLTLAALLCGKTVKQPEALAFTDMPIKFSHHFRQQKRWGRGSFIRGIWRIRFLRLNTYGWVRQFLGWFVYFSSLYLLCALLLSNPYWTFGTLLPLSIFCSYIYGLRYFSISRSDMKWYSQFFTYLLSPFAIVWSMVILRFTRLYAILTCVKAKWGTRQKVEQV